MRLVVDTVNEANVKPNHSYESTKTGSTIVMTLVLHSQKDSKVPVLWFVWMKSGFEHRLKYIG